MELLLPDEKHELERKSSISQFEGFLAVRKGSEWCPIAYDVLDAVRCNKVESHKAIITRKPYIGYAFPVQECRYLSDSYVLGEDKGIELVPLPEQFGVGFYESAYDRKFFVNGENGSLGVHNDITLRVGQDYVLANDSLDPDD